MKMFANHGALIKHTHLMEGINSRLDGLQAAVLSAKLPHILEWTQKRIAAAAYYDKILCDVPEILLPKIRSNSMHSFHLYVIQAEHRDNLSIYLKDRGVEIFIHYPTPLPFMPAYKYLGCKREDFPVISHNQSRIMSIPIFPEITREQQDYVTGAIRDFYKKT